MVKVRRFGSSAGVVLPRDVLVRLGVQAGDELCLVETPAGYEITRYDPQLAEQLESAPKGMNAYKNTLGELAK